MVWNIAWDDDIADLIPVVPGLVEHFKLRLKYLLIDENAYSDTELASLNNLVAAVFRFEQADSPATIEQWALAYIAEGELKGELKGTLKGEMLALQRLLSNALVPYLPKLPV